MKATEAAKEEVCRSDEEKKTTRRRRKLTRTDMERMQIPKRFWKVSFGEISEGNHKGIIRRFLQGIVRAMLEGYGIILWGDNDCGKTSAAVVIMKEARRIGYHCLFVRSSQYRQQVMNKAVFDENFSLQDWCTDVDLLVVDDIGKEPGSKESSGGSERMLEDLLRERSSNMKSSIITMNSDPSKLEERYSKSLKSLMRENFVSVHLDGPSKRTEKTKTMSEFFRGKEKA